MPKGPSLRVGREAARGRSRGPSADLRHLRGRHPGRQLRRRPCRRLRPRHLGLRRRSARSARRGQARFRPAAATSCSGGWKLVRTNMRGKQKQWLLIKRDDAHARQTCEADDLRRGKPRAPAQGEEDGRQPAPAKARRRTNRRQRSSRAGANARWRSTVRATRGYAGRLRAAARHAARRAARGRRLAARDQVGRLPDDGRPGRRHGQAAFAQRPRLDRRPFPKSPRRWKRCRSPTRCLDGELVVLERRTAAAISPRCSGRSTAPRRRSCATWCSTCPAGGVDLSEAPLLRAQGAAEATARPQGRACWPSATHVVGHGAEVFDASEAAGPRRHRQQARRQRLSVAVAAATGSRSSTRTATSSSSSATPRPRARAMASARC